MCIIYEASLSNAHLAAKIIAKGNISIMPTDTLYALSVDACSDGSIKKLYNVKKRAINKLCPVLVNSIEMAEKYAHINEISYKLMEKFWPGALSIVLPLKNESNLSLHNDNQEDVAIRVPDDHFTLKVIELLGKPIIGTSANISGSPNEIDHYKLKSVFKDSVEGIFFKKNMIIGSSSTIISTRNNKIKVLREGRIKVSDLIEI